MPGIYVLALPPGVSHLFYIPHWSSDHIYDTMAVAFVVCFYVKVDRTHPSLLQLCSLGLSRSCHQLSSSLEAVSSGSADESTGPALKSSDAFASLSDDLRGALNKFPDFFVQASKMVVHS